MEQRKDKPGKTWFTGVIKTAHADFPKAFLTERLKGKGAGAHYYLTAEIAGVTYYAIGYRYTQKRNVYLITNRGDLMNGKPYLQRWADEFSNVCSRAIPRFTLISEYFQYSNTVDIHNQYRQKLLALEKAWVTTDGWFRIFTTIVGTVVTDAFLAYKTFTAQTDNQLITMRWFVDRLASDMLRGANVDEEEDVKDILGWHPLINIPKKPNSKQVATQVQKRCVICRKAGRNNVKTTYMCQNPRCTQNNLGPVYICKRGSNTYNCHLIHAKCEGCE